MSAKLAINAALYSTLSGGTALTSLLAGTTSVFHMQAPDGATLPYVIFSHVFGGPTNSDPSNDREQTIFVRGYANRAILAGSIDYQISELLHRKILSIVGYTNFWTSREEEFEAVEILPSEDKVFMVGANYLIKIDS